MQRTRAYNVWSEQEKQALQDGVLKHGLGAWEVIRKDPEFACLEKRSGVQLKDKFRNLIKFRHLSEDQSRQLKPKANGPWSRKYTSSGNQQFERPHTRSPSRLTSPIPTPENEHAEALLALEYRGQSGNGEDTQSEGEGGQASKQARKRRRSLENRNFGIYDTRRYKADGTQWVEGDGMQGTYTHEELVQRGRGRGCGRGRRRASARARSRYDDYDDEDSEETEREGEEESEAQRNGDLRRSQRSSRRRQLNASATTTTTTSTGPHASIVACPCGAQEDDGTLMIECEDCKCWAHTECLQNALVHNPLQYNLEHYQCLNCQHRAACALLGGAPGGGKGVNSSFPLAQLPLSLSPFGMPPDPHGHLGGVLPGMHGFLPPGMATGVSPFAGGLGALMSSVPLHPVQHQSQQGASSGGLAALFGLGGGGGLLGPCSGGGEGDGMASSSAALAVLAAQQQELLRCTGLLGPQPLLQPQLSAPQQQRSGGGGGGGVSAEGGVDAESLAEAAVSVSMGGKQAGCGGATDNGSGGSAGQPGGVSPSNEAIVQLLALTSRDGPKDSVLDEDAANGLPMARPGSTRPLLRANSSGCAKRGGSGSAGSMDEWGAALQGLQSHSMGMAGLIRSGSSMGLGNGNPVASDDYADPLANFLAINRAGSALGHHSNSPARTSAALHTSTGALADPLPISSVPSPMSAAAAAVNASAAATAAAQRARAERVTSGSMGVIGGSSSNLCAEGIGDGSGRSIERGSSRALGPGTLISTGAAAGADGGPTPAAFPGSNSNRMSTYSSGLGTHGPSHHSLDRLLAVAHAAGGESNEPLGSSTSEAAAAAAVAAAADPAGTVATKLEEQDADQPGALPPPSGPSVLHHPLAQHAGRGGLRPPSRGPLLPPSTLPTPALPPAAPLTNGGGVGGSDPANEQQGAGIAAAAAAGDAHSQPHQHQQLQQAQPHLQSCPPPFLLGLWGAAPMGNPHSTGMPLFPHHHHHLAYPNRAPTPSSAFIDSLLRGATPDIAIAPLMHGAAVAGNGGAAGAQLSQLSSIHQELAQLTHGGHPGLGGPLDALRPGTPDAWAFLHGATTPTPDFHILQATLANDFGAGGANWLYHRGTPPLAPVADLQVPQPLQHIEQQPQLQQPPQPHTSHISEHQLQLQQPPQSHPSHISEHQLQLQQPPQSHPSHILEQQPQLQQPPPQSHSSHILEQQPQLQQPPQSHPSHTLELQPQLQQPQPHLSHTLEQQPQLQQPPPQSHPSHTLEQQPQLQQPPPQSHPSHTSEQQPQLQQPPHPHPGHTLEQQPQLQLPPHPHPGHAAEQQPLPQQLPQSHPSHTSEQQPQPQQPPQSRPGHTLEQQPQLQQPPQSRPGHTLEQQPQLQQPPQSHPSHAAEQQPAIAVPGPNTHTDVGLYFQEFAAPGPDVRADVGKGQANGEAPKSCVQGAASSSVDARGEPSHQAAHAVAAADSWAVHAPQLAVHAQQGVLAQQQGACGDPQDACGDPRTQQGVQAQQQGSCVHLHAHKGVQAQQQGTCGDPLKQLGVQVQQQGTCVDPCTQQGAHVQQQGACGDSRVQGPQTASAGVPSHAAPDGPMSTGATCNAAAAHSEQCAQG